MKYRLLAGAGIATGLFFAMGFWVYVLMPRPVDAARNASGTMAKLYSFSPNTTINSTNMNSQFSDFESEMTDSLSRSGKGGMTAALRGSDGTVTAPAFAFTSETGTGLYRIGSSDLGVAINQVKKLELTSSLFTVTPDTTFSGNETFTGWARAANGTVAAPSLSFTSDTGSGLYWNTTNDIRLAINGADVQLWNATGTATTTNGKWFTPSLADGNSVFMYYGKSTSTGSAGQFTYTKNATAANSTSCLAVAGGANSTLCVDGNSKTYIGASGTGTAQMNFGSCTLNGASPSVCTATVASGAKCVAIDVATTAATRCLATSVTTTTLTVTSCNGNTNVVNYVCF